MVNDSQSPSGRIVLLSLVAGLACAVLWLLTVYGSVASAPGDHPSASISPTPEEHAIPRSATRASPIDAPAKAPAPVLPGERTAVGASLAGRTLGRDGSVLSGVAVVATDGTATHSGADGHFVLSGLPRGVHSLRAEAEGLIGVPSGSILVRGGETIDGIDLILDQANYVSGRVTSGPNQALAEARVSGRLRDAAAFPDFPPGALLAAARLSVATDADGRFRLGPFAPGRIELTVEHESCIPFARLFPSDASGVQINVAPASCISGVVLEPEGQNPAFLECVRLLVANPNRPGWSIASEVKPSPEDAAAGRFHLPVPMPLAVVVAAVTRDFAIATSEPIRITPGKPLPPIELRASAGTRLLGKVHDAAGPAVAGAEISLREDGVACEVAHLVSAADGSFGLALAPGRYTARIRKPGYAPQQLPIEVVADQPAPALDAALVRGGGLRGSILAAEGAVLPSLEVHARRADDAKAQPEVAMVGDGAYTFDFLPPGDYLVALRERGARVPLHDGVAVRVGLGEVPQLDLSPGESGMSRLHGDITRNGAPMPFVTVNLQRNPGRKFATATADRHGHFEFDALAAGPLTLTVTHGATGPVLFGRALELRPGEDRDEAVSIACGSVTGRVVTAADKTPIHEIRVDVLSTDGRTLASTRSGSDGRFSLPMVQAGNWYLGFGRIGEPVAMRQAVQVIAGQASEVAEVEL